MDRLLQLDTLIASLIDLIEVLRLDARCQWLSHFEQCLERAKETLGAGASQSDLNGLSASVMSVFKGAGSFSDYAPVTLNRTDATFKVIAGMESVHDYGARVRDSALQLRVVDYAL